MPLHPSSLLLLLLCNVWACVSYVFVFHFCFHSYISPSLTNKHTFVRVYSQCVNVCATPSIEWANTRMVGVYVSYQFTLHWIGFDLCLYVWVYVRILWRYVRSVWTYTKRTIVFVGTSCMCYLCQTDSFDSVSLCLCFESNSQLSWFDVSKTVWFSPITHTWKIHIKVHQYNAIHWEKDYREERIKEIEREEESNKSEILSNELLIHT